jgi:Putative Ig domain
MLSIGNNAEPPPGGSIRWLEREAKLLGCLACLFLTVSAAAQLTLSPTSITYANQVIGTTSFPMYVTAQNNTTQAVTITGLTFSCPQFVRANGPVPATVKPGGVLKYGISFAPLAQTTYSCQAMFSFKVFPTQSVSLSGTGIPTLTISPSSANFGTITVGQISGITKFTATNIGPQTIRISNVAVTPSEFELVAGGPVGLQPGSSTHFQIQFAPDAAQVFNGTMTITLGSNTVPIVVPLTGTGVSTTASVSVSPTSMSFPNEPAGTTSPAQTVTITNTGSSNVTVDVPYITPPFLVTGASNVVLTPGQSTTLSVSLFGTFVGSYTGTLNIPFDVLNPSGLSLTGNTVAATALGINTFPNMPLGTASSPYLATLTAVGGTPPYTWSVISGAFPSGLTLASDGTITGNFAASPANSSVFTVQAVDSVGSTATSTLTIGAGKLTGANCNDIDFDVPGLSTPLTALNDLGTGTYLGYEGGLYPNGSNIPPTSHENDGITRALAIQPLNAQGQPDPNGVYGLLSMGPSDTQQEYIELQTLGNADPSKNPHLVLVQGAQPGATARYWADLTSTYWTTLLNTLLPEAGVTPQQIAVVWVQAFDVGTTGIYPQDMQNSQADMETTANNIYTEFPNATIIYYTGRIYGGYGNGVNTYEPEPQAYDTGFAVKAVIADQINGNPNLNYNPNNGPVVAPWIAWGPYYWANGLLARSDGLTWSCQELKHDGLHPEDPLGREKVAAALLNFLKTDPTAAPWFLAPGSQNKKSAASGNLK